tara:strand:+ start:926 stop:1405 length:480 start_codon:yes stop_codon:yes gene_type:complete
MEFSKILETDLQCNYLDLNKKNSQQMLLSCINAPDKKYDCPISRGSINIEGFSSDMSSSGVYYVPEGSCPDGYNKEGNKCIQQFRGRVRDGNWQRSHHHGEITHFQTNQNNTNFCGNGFVFQGIDNNGYINCSESNKIIQENKIEDNDDDDNYIYSSIL